MPGPQFRCAHLKLTVPISQAQPLRDHWCNLGGNKAFKYLVGSGSRKASTLEINVIAQAPEKFSKKKFRDLLIPSNISQRHAKLVPCKPGRIRDEIFLACKGSSSTGVSDGIMFFEYGSMGRGFVSSRAVLHNAHSLDDSHVLPAFKCPISQCIMADPVIVVESGHSYERSRIKNWLRDHRTGNVL